MGSHVIPGRAAGARPLRSRRGRPVRALAACVLVAAAAVAGPMAVTRAASADIIDRAALLGSMLQDDDIPTWRPAGDTEDTDDTDFAEFNAHGGIRGLVRTWHEMSVSGTLVEFRWQLPDGPEALAFLDEAEEMLGEVASGSARRDPPAGLLPDTRYYFDDDVFDMGLMSAHTFLMRHGSVVAKVYVGGRGDELAEEDAVAIAQASADRMVAALPAGPDDGPVRTPGASPEGAADPADLAEVMSHIPSAVGSDCTEEARSDQGIEDGVLASVVCTQSSVTSILYQLYDSARSLDADFDRGGTVAGIMGWAPTPDGTCDAGTYEGTWTLGDEEAGRLRCATILGGASITWTHPATLLEAVIRQEDGDTEAAFQLWFEAGPV